jgi:predicted HAD superfamily Cof-like phosphohydrolase
MTSGPKVKSVQKALIDEEWSEFHEAYHFKEEDEQLKELADLVYVCYQMAASQDWDQDEAMRRVHESNMSKLGEDGKPIYRADGKVLKGPNYKPPYLNDLIIE